MQLYSLVTMLYLSVPGKCMHTLLLAVLDVLLNYGISVTIEPP
jgi:hypothetical protein